MSRASEIKQMRNEKSRKNKEWVAVATQNWPVLQFGSYLQLSSLNNSLRLGLYGSLRLGHELLKYLVHRCKVDPVELQSFQVQTLQNSGVWMSGVKRDDGEKRVRVTK